MTLFDTIRQRVTAREAAERYGLRFRRNRARCPWHDDSNPDLAFYENGTCYCHACHNGGDAVALTAQVFGLTMIEAAKQINADFSLGLGADKPVSTIVRNQVKQQRQRRDQAAEESRREWSLLCDVAHKADRQIAAVVNRLPSGEWEKAWDDPRFVQALRYRSRVENDLDQAWEEMAVTRYG